MNVSTDLQRHYSAGPQWMYQYTYADPASVGPRQPLQLEFWLPKGRRGGRWVPQHLTHGLTGFSKAWRRVIPGHSHADKLAHSIAISTASHAPSHDRSKVCDTYCAWARLKGLMCVTTYLGDRVSNKAARLAGLQRREVDPAEFIGPVAAETENEGLAA